LMQKKVKNNKERMLNFILQTIGLAL
jgi:hypothetical protein